MTESLRVHIWRSVAAVALAAALMPAANAQTPASPSAPDQSAPAASSGGVADNVTVYETNTSEACDKQNNSTPFVDGYNPALCFKLVLTQSGLQCPKVGGKDSTFAGQAGNNCYYCQQPRLPGAQAVIPSSGGVGFGMDSYSWICTENPHDSCYLSCFGDLPPPVSAPGATMKQVTGPNGLKTYQVTITNDPCMPEGEAGPNACSVPNLPSSMLPAGCVCNSAELQKIAASQAKPNPCFPAGSQNYNACDYPNVTKPAGCSCSKTPQPQASTQPAPKPATASASQPPNEGQYLQGMVDGITSCLQDLLTTWSGLTAGAGYFAQGNFLQAAQLWGVKPGQSALAGMIASQLNTAYYEMMTPQIGSNVTAYQQGVAGGKRLCQYFLIPAAKAAGKAALQGAANGVAGSTGGTGGSSTPNTPQQIPGPSNTSPQLPGGSSNNPPQIGSTGSAPGRSPPSVSGPGPSIPLLPKVDPGSPPVSSPSLPTQANPTLPAPANPTLPTQATQAQAGSGAGSADTPDFQGGGNGLSATNPYWGGVLQNFIDYSPDSLQGKFVKLADSRVIQVGKLLGAGGFAVVYQYGDLAIKFSKALKANGYGPASLAGQSEGTKLLQGTGVLTPKVYEFQAGGNGVPASLVVDNANTAFPGFKPISRQMFQGMTAAQQGEVLKAQNALTNDIAAKGMVLGDPNPRNIEYKAMPGGSYQAVLVDTDQVMTPAQIAAEYESFLAELAKDPDAMSVPLGILGWGIRESGENFSYTNTSAQEWTDMLNQARENILRTPPEASNAAPPDGQ